MYLFYYGLIVTLVIIFDQLSKIWIVNNFILYGTREVIPGFFNLVYVVNTGAAFSMFADVDSPWRHYFFVTIGVGAMVGLTIFAYSLRKEHIIYTLSLGLIAGGAIGNLIDRLYYGHVVDFLDVYVNRYHWPAFNIADSAICVGAVLYLIITLKEARREKAKKQGIIS